MPFRQRAALMRRFRHELVQDVDALVATLTPRPAVHALSAEILPLADAAGFLERRGAGLLRSRRPGRRHQPLWLSGHRAEVCREPLGTVLIIAPDNYPLMLPGIQALQALFAGNAVLVKPAVGCTPPMQRLCHLLARAGLPDDLCEVLPEELEPVKAIMAQGVDHVVLTGSATTGRAVLHELAETLTPATMELSGCDAVLVLDDADPDFVARALVFGLRLNNGATCIAPRRVFVTSARAAALEAALVRRLDALPELPIKPTVASRLAELVADATAAGARVRPDVRPSAAATAPFALFDVPLAARIVSADLFAPVLSVLVVENEDAAVPAIAQCPYALNASIFGSVYRAQVLARRLPAGTVTINDIITPTADPRLPFGGRGESGFGVTRGAEGLLAMTAPKVITESGGSYRPQWSDPETTHLEAARGYLALAHGSGAERAAGLVRLFRALRRLSRAQ